MRVSWREIVGLLIGLAICYGLISYAVTNGPQIREVASEQARENSRGGATDEQTTESTDGETKTVTVRVTGPRGYSFGANYGNLLSSETVEGTVPADYEVRVRTDPSTGDNVYATAWKNAGDSKELKIQILDGGTVLKEHSTKKDYGATSVRWSPNEPPPAETTTPTDSQKGAAKTPTPEKSPTPGAPVPKAQ